MNTARFESGGRARAIAAGLGTGGLFATALGAAASPRAALGSYLVAYCYWAGLCGAAVILLAIFHVAHARWVVVFRRLLETMAASAVLFVPLFVPLALGLGHLYPWVLPPSGPESLRLWAHQRPYLNVPFFLGRAALYVGVWAVVGELLRRWSQQQDDRAGDASLTRQQRRLSAGALPLLALTLTFASFDWLMSLSPAWYSTLFGVYYFAGSFLAAIALLTWLTAWPALGLWGTVVNEEHLRSLGKLLLAFVSFWAYLGFSHFLLMWIANLPEEVPWFIARTEGGWRKVGWFLFYGHFLVPFLVLLSKQLKSRPWFLMGVAGWILFAHFVDLYWVAMPTLYPRGPSPRWTDLTAFFGVGGASVAFAVHRLKGHRPVAVGDPAFADSLRYAP